VEERLKGRRKKVKRARKEYWKGGKEEKHSNTDIRVENLSPAMGRGINSRNRVWN
jgi:hypothetical protein